MTTSTSSYHHLLTPSILSSARQSPRPKYVHIIDSEHTLKLGRSSIYTDYEYRVLRFLERIVGTAPCTQSIPCSIPKPIDFFKIDVPRKTLIDGKAKVKDANKANDEVEKWNVMVMSTLPGRTLSTCRMDKEDRMKVMISVGRFMDEINRVIDLEGVKQNEIGEMDGTRCLKFPFIDGYINGRVEPEMFVEKMAGATFQTTTDNMVEKQRDVLEVLRPALASFPNRPVSSSSSSSTSSPIADTIRFCHMDLHPENILIVDTKIISIVDWEFSGYYTSTLEYFAALRHLYPTSMTTMDEYIRAWGIAENVVQSVKVCYDVLWEGLMRSKTEQAFLYWSNEQDGKQNGGKSRRRVKIPK